MKDFQIPHFYRSPIITTIKEIRRDKDGRKKNFEPTELDFGPVRFYVARHFGFCYGVENAIEISYRTVEVNPGKRIFLLSEMIHNPNVNDDLRRRGIDFIMDTHGNQLIDWGEITSDDIVIIPAFGTTLEIKEKLEKMGIDTYKYNTTCPFVEKVWNRSKQLGEKDYTIIIHGKHYHEETRATFSHSSHKAPSVIVRDINEAKFLASVITGEGKDEEFYSFFAGKYSKNFDLKKDLMKIGVVNQTTMLATETEAIANLLREAMIKKFGAGEINKHFADTRDTLCYATYDNQAATINLLDQKGDFAVVVGGYNSSNTSHLVELCEKKMETYFISSSEKILSDKLISHFDINSGSEKITENFIPKKEKINILITSGASCPDALVDEVIQKIVSFFDRARRVEDVLAGLKNNLVS